MNKSLKETLKEVIQLQLDISHKVEVISKGTKDSEPVYGWRNKYDAYSLEPIHIADSLELTLSGLEKVIVDCGDWEVMSMWNNYKHRGYLAKIYDNDFSQIKPQLAEFVLKWFSKDQVMMSDVIVKKNEADIIELEAEISRLTKEVEFYKKGNK